MKHAATTQQPQPSAIMPAGTPDTKAAKVVEWFYSLDREGDSLVSRTMFFAAFFIWFIAMSLLGMTGFMNLEPFKINHEQWCFAALYILLVREILFGKWDRQALFGGAVCLFLGFVAYQAKDPATMTAAALIFCGRNMPFRRLAWVMFVSTLVVLVVTIVASQTGVIQDTIMFRGTIPRHTLGFAHPNTSTIYAFFALCLWVYLRGRDFSFVDAAVWLVVFGVLYWVTNGRAGCLLGAALTIVALVLRFIPEKALKSPVLLVVAICAILGCAAVAIGVTITFDPSVGWMAYLDKILSGRMSLAHNAMLKHGVSAFASTADYVRDIIVDCGYARLFLKFGYVYTILGLLLAVLVAAKAWACRNWYLVAAIAIASFHGLSEATILMLQFNGMLFLIGGLFIRGYDGFNPKGQPLSAQQTEDVVKLKRVDGALDGLFKLDAKGKSLVSQLMFFVPFVIWLNVVNVCMFTQFGVSVEPRILTLLCYACIGVLTVREFLFGTWDRRALVGAILFGFMMYMMYLAGDFVVGTGALFIFSARNVPIWRVLWVSFVSLVAILVITILAALIGVIPETPTSAQLGGVHYLGFLSTKTAAAYVLAAVCVWVLLRERKIAIPDIAVCCVACIAVGWITGAWLPCVLGVVIAMLAFAFRFISSRVMESRVIPAVAVALIALFSLGSIALVACYQPGVAWMSALNDAMAGALNMANVALSSSDWALLVPSPAEDAGPVIAIELGYVHLVQSYGVLYLVIVLGVMVAVAFRSWRCGSGFLVAVLCAVAVYGAFATTAFALPVDPLLVFAGGLYLVGFDGFNRSIVQTGRHSAGIEAPEAV